MSEVGKPHPTVKADPELIAQAQHDLDTPWLWVGRESYANMLAANLSRWLTPGLQYTQRIDDGVRNTLIKNYILRMHHHAREQAELRTHLRQRFNPPLTVAFIARGLLGFDSVGPVKRWTSRPDWPKAIEEPGREAPIYWFWDVFEWLDAHEDLVAKGHQRASRQKTARTSTREEIVLQQQIIKQQQEQIAALLAAVKSQPK